MKSVAPYNQTSCWTAIPPSERRSVWHDETISANCRDCSALGSPNINLLWREWFNFDELFEVRGIMRFQKLMRVGFGAV
jgi:hypothetical protein